MSGEPQRFVYFVRPIGTEGPVKIGCSTAPASRVETYCTWSPVPLEIVATIPGGWSVEWAFHAKFAALRLHHEWFSADPELTATIEAIRSGSFNTATLPAPKRLRSAAQQRAWTRKRAA